MRWGTIKNHRRYQMKRLLVIVAVILAVGLSSLAYADTHAKHDQQWRQQHAQVWKSHSKQWSEYDREWQAHRGATREDIKWRKDHAQLWHDWYQWHNDERDDGGKSGLSIQLDLNF